MGEIAKKADGMNVNDIVLALLPSLMMFFAVSMGASSLERLVQNYARGRFHLDRLVIEANAARLQVEEVRVQHDRLTEEKAKLELELGELKSKYGQQLAREVELSDPRNMTVYESGLPRPNASGWYVKAIGPEMNEIFSGPGSGVSRFPGRRTARMVIWGAADAETARLRAKASFGALSEIMVIRPFAGKIRLDDA